MRSTGFPIFRAGSGVDPAQTERTLEARETVDPRWGFAVYPHPNLLGSIYIDTMRFLPIIVDVLGLGGPDGPGNLASKVFPGLLGPPGPRKSAIHGRIRGRSGSDREDLRG